MSFPTLARTVAAFVLAAAFSSAPTLALAAMSDADRAALQIRTWGGSPVHIGDTLDQARAALPSAPATPQINLGDYQTLWAQADGVILRLSHGVVTQITYDTKSKAKIAGLDVGIDSTLADFEAALGPSAPGVVPGTRTWALDGKHRLVASVYGAGVVRGLELGFIPKPPPPRPAGGVAWADAREASAASAAAPVLTGDARRARLDQLLAAHDDVALLQLLFPQFQKQPPLPREAESIDDAWLQAHAGEGRASVLYALSWKLLPFDRDSARTLNARARVEWQMASAQCVQAPQPSPLMFMLEGEAVVDVAPLRAAKPAWPIAFGQALDWDRALASPVGPDWYCGAGNVMAASAAAAARQAAWQRARDANPAPTNAAP